MTTAYQPDAITATRHGEWSDPHATIRLTATDGTYGTIMDFTVDAAARVRDLLAAHVAALTPPKRPEQYFSLFQSVATTALRDATKRDDQRAVAWWTWWKKTYNRVNAGHTLAVDGAATLLAMTDPLVAVLRARAERLLLPVEQYTEPTDDITGLPEVRYNHWRGGATVPDAATRYADAVRNLRHVLRLREQCEVFIARFSEHDQQVVAGLRALGHSISELPHETS